MARLRRVLLELGAALLIALAICGPLFSLGYLYFCNEKLSQAIESGDKEKVAKHSKHLYELYDWGRQIKAERVLDRLLIFRFILENEVTWLYENGEYEAVLKRTKGVKASWAHFARGNAYFRKVVAEELSSSGSENILDQSKEEYFKSIILDPDHFDSKFNYEIMADKQTRQKVVAKQKAKAQGQNPQEGKEGQEGKVKGPKPSGGKKPYNIKDIGRQSGSGGSNKRG
ncbi:MAG: hypothetical protein Q7S32_02970 [bacterium]|nr:hypothetical protein [bacterium]